MTEEKQQVENGKLLVSDLCARLPYKVKLQKVGEPDTVYELYSMNVETLEICFWKYKGKSLNIADADKLYRYGKQRYKPYLRSMSSMTPEELEQYENLCDLYIDKWGKHYFKNVSAVAWLYSKHFDVNGLLPLDLALVAPKDMYKL